MLRLAVRQCRGLGKCAHPCDLQNWVPREALVLESDRKLVVRIHRTPTGAKVSDVSLLDATGATVAEEHEPFDSRTACHKVLYDTARDAAKLLGAFEKPPAPAPIVCPTCAACAACPEPKPCPIPIAARPGAMTAATSTEPLRRAFVGGGMSIGTGIAEQAALGPLLMFGFVPSKHSPRLHLELMGGWTLQTVRELRLQTVPISGLMCYLRNEFRFCGGMTSTFLSTSDDDLGIAMAGTMRLGTEFDIVGHWSMRVDGYVLANFWQRTFGKETAALDDAHRLAAGFAALAVWAWE